MLRLPVQNQFESNRSMASLSGSRLIRLLFILQNLKSGILGAYYWDSLIFKFVEEANSMGNNLDEHGMDQRFGYGDGAAFIGNSTETRGLKGNFNRNVLIDMYQHHSVVHVGREGDQGEAKKVLAIGFNPKDIDKDAQVSQSEVQAGDKPETLERTRSVGIYRFADELASKGEYVDTYLQFDLYVEATDKASGLDNSRGPESPLTMLEQAVNDADYVLLAWGSAGQQALKINHGFTDALKPLLRDNQNKLYYLHTEKNPELCYSAAASISKDALTKLAFSSFGLFN